MRAWLLIAAGIAVYWWHRKQQDTALVFTEVNSDDPTTPGVLQKLEEIFQPELDAMDDPTIEQRRNAFLYLLRVSEGTQAYENPYAIIFGGKEMDGFTFQDHPGNIGFTDWTYFTANGKRTYSTASGAYQFLLSTWNRLAGKLNLTDFSPASQDRAALELARERSALDDIDAGDIEKAISKLNTIWASLPGSPYGQPMHDMDYLLAVYNNSINDQLA